MELGKHLVEEFTNEHGFFLQALTARLHGIGELQAFIKEKPGMTQGWTGSLDKLEALVSG